MSSDQQYFRPRCDERTYEEAVERATFLIDGGYIKLSSGLTFEQVVESLARKILKDKRENKDK